MPHVSQSLWGLFLTPSHVGSAPAFSHLNQHEEWLKCRIRDVGEVAKIGGAGSPGAHLLPQAPKPHLPREQLLLGLIWRPAEKSFHSKNRRQGLAANQPRTSNLPHVYSSCPPSEKDPCSPHRCHSLSRHSDDKRGICCWIPTKRILHEATSPRLGNVTNLDTKN